MINFPNAKINIGLNITSRRKDGYHNLESIFYPVNIKDALEMVVSEQLHFQSSGLSIPGNTGENLCVKAYHLLRERYPILPVNIHLHKQIPIGAGLGGGSADAAFCIRLLNDVFTLQLSSAQMRDFARQLGADCAFFIDNKPALAFEKGDCLEPVSLDLSGYAIVLLMPDIFVSTEEAYRSITPAVPEQSLKEAIGLPVEEWKQTIVNDFENSVFKVHPALRILKDTLYNRGALYASMSGSGSSIYGIFKTKPDLSDLEKSIQVFYNL
ncbi:MAG: 4-(cytidine 5'-diphospho)-2-C-methyl-D-erythritol kinase [Sphingobacteriaceae bacterium]